MMVAVFYDYLIAKKIPKAIVIQYALAATVLAIGASSPKFFPLTIVGVLLFARALSQRLKKPPR